MHVGNKLYGMVWLNFGVFMLAFYRNAFFSPYVHAISGALIVFLAIINRKGLAQTACPARIKRIATVMVFMSIATAITGAICAAPFWGIGKEIARFLHLTVTAALFTQSSSVATTFDMWQEKQFVSTTLD